MLRLTSNTAFVGDKTQLPGYFPLIDTVPLFAGGVRKLIKNYSGPLLQVRRSSDNTTQDIYPDSQGMLDTTSLLSFAGAGSAFVSVIYDQSGNGNNATRVTLSGQPIIVNAGNINKVNGKVAINFSDSGKAMGLPQSVSIAMGGSTFLGISMVVQISKTPTAACSLFSFYDNASHRRFSCGIGYNTQDFNKYQAFHNNTSNVAQATTSVVENDSTVYGNNNVITSWVDLSNKQMGIMLDGVTPQTATIAGGTLGVVDNTGIIGAASWSSGSPVDGALFNFSEMILVNKSSPYIKTSIPANQISIYQSK